MSIRFVGYALHADIYQQNPSAKLLLIALCNYADESGRCFGSNKGLAEIVGSDPRHIRRLKLKLTADRLIQNHEGGGRGNANRFTLNIEKLEQISARKRGHDGHLLAWGKEDIENTKEDIGYPKRGHGSPPKGKKVYKRARARDARVIDDDLTRSANQEVGRHDLGDGAPVFREMIEQKFGVGFSRSWIDQCSIDASSEGVEILAPLAFVKSSIENQCSAWLYENEAMVVVAKVDERARL